MLGCGNCCALFDGDTAIGTNQITTVTFLGTGWIYLVIPCCFVVVTIRGVQFFENLNLLVIAGGAGVGQFALGGTTRFLCVNRRAPIVICQTTANIAIQNLGFYLTGTTCGNCAVTPITPVSPLTIRIGLCFDLVSLTIDGSLEVPVCILTTTIITCIPGIGADVIGDVVGAVVSMETPESIGISITDGAVVRLF